MLEFWEGGFTYRPGRIDLVCKVTLDHNFITLKMMKPVAKELIAKHREELHLLLTTNQCHYYFESLPGRPDLVNLVLAKYIYASAPPDDEVQVVLDMLAHGSTDLEKALANDFKDWKPGVSV